MNVLEVNLEQQTIVEVMVFASDLASILLASRAGADEAKGMPNKRIKLLTTLTISAAGLSMVKIRPTSVIG